MLRCVCKWKRGKETVECADAGYRDIPHVSGAGTQVCRVARMTQERTALNQFSLWGQGAKNNNGMGNRSLIFLESGPCWLWDTRNPFNTSRPIWLQ